ncbi:unnamed protein product [Soboliphyme baturini]|uniref:Uncharacterized protein n=1 Tax=Soboliphyme baturini TaxID=241478 RepID=A0A183IC55_9BILA|nr:unnamed protein product [Soboliphyme baturini]
MTCVTVFRLDNRLVKEKQLSFGQHVQHEAKPTYLHFILDRTLSFKPHLEKTAAGQLVNLTCYENLLAPLWEQAFACCILQPCRLYILSQSIVPLFDATAAT